MRDTRHETVLFHTLLAQRVLTHLEGDWPEDLKTAQVHIEHAMATLDRFLNTLIDKELEHLKRSLVTNVKGPL